MEQEVIRQKLVEAIAKTEAQIKTYRELTKPVAPDVAIGRVSRMDAINNKSVIEMALRQAETKLANLKSVFSKLGSNEFGGCLKCHNEIPLERILIRPESRFCVQCAK